jgi:glycine oxidase
MPILGPCPIDGLVLATGHHRNGFLLTPVTAALIADHILHDRADSRLTPFQLDRFGSART